MSPEITDALQVKFRAGKYMVPGSIAPTDDGRIVIGFRYNKTLIEEIKDFEGARWNPEKKKWTIKDTQRNRFQLDYLLGLNPYARYDLPLVEHTPSRPLYRHQLEMARHGLTRHYCLFAAEMGCGKTLAAIEVMEASGFKDWWWVGPKSALRSVQLEFEKWKSAVRPRMFTYEAITREMKRWPPGKKAPHGVVFDESSRVKTPTAQRTQAAMQLADGIREDWGDEGYVILMSGTPAPKSPADWWSQSECACPGFLREGTIDKFKRRLGLIVQKESIQGGVYPQLITWKDSVDKCAVCGQLKTHESHDTLAIVTTGDYHPFVPGTNEVEHLYKRLQGLVLVQFKKDCLDLPEKRYEVIRVQPTATTLRAATLITAMSTTVIQTMTLLRELSDGFQYSEEDAGTEPCPLCKGRKEIDAPALDGKIDVTYENVDELRDRYPDYRQAIQPGSSFTPPEAVAGYDARLGTEPISCPRCGGDGEITRYRRSVTMVACPKEDAVRELLDRYDDVGRTVWYGGFTGSVDRIEQICLDLDWEVVRVDGRGWKASWANVSELDMLRVFQSGSTEDHPRVAFVGQPSAAGMGLTLTASPMIAFYSNDFNGESRWQAEDRIHRAGMDVNRGCVIYDIVHLPTDEKVLENLRQKRDLLNMSLGELKDVIGRAAESKERSL